jgi:hypothetical protein
MDQGSSVLHRMSMDLSDKALVFHRWIGTGLFIGSGLVFSLDRIMGSSGIRIYLFSSDRDVIFQDKDQNG